MLPSILSWSSDNLIIFQAIKIMCFSFKVTEYTIPIFCVSGSISYMLTKEFFQFLNITQLTSKQNMVTLSMWTNSPTLFNQMLRICLAHKKGSQNTLHDQSIPQRNHFFLSTKPTSYSLLQKREVVLFTCSILTTVTSPHFLKVF